MSFTLVTSCYHGSLKAKPDIIVILADDMGFSDIGYYGGEIRPPNQDAHAEDAMRFTQFYTPPCCGPAGTSVLMAGLQVIGKPFRVMFLPWIV